MRMLKHPHGHPAPCGIRDAKSIRVASEASRQHPGSIQAGCRRDAASRQRLAGTKDIRYIKIDTHFNSKAISVAKSNAVLLEPFLQRWTVGDPASSGIGAASRGIEAASAVSIRGV